MPHTLVPELGTFSSKLPNWVQDFVIGEQLTRRLMDCSDAAGKLPLKRVSALKKLQINNRKDSQGVYGKPGNDLGNKFRNLRCDKQSDKMINVNGMNIPYACFQVQIVGAHGGILVPYNTDFSFDELENALRASMDSSPNGGYAVLYKGEKPKVKSAKVSNKNKKSK